MAYYTPPNYNAVNFELQAYQPPDNTAVNIALYMPPQATFSAQTMRVLTVPASCVGQTCRVLTDAATFSGQTIRRLTEGSEADRMIGRLISFFRQEVAQVE